MVTKMDQRKVKTRARFRKALLYLLRDYRFEDITLTEISKYAEVNRVTFYGHYHDKYELLDDVINDTLEGFRESVLKRAFSDSAKDHSEQPPVMMVMLTYIQEHSLFFETMLSERRVPGFIPLFINTIEEIYQHIILSCGADVDLTLYRKYITSATLGMISYWIKSGMIDSPDYIANQVKIVLNENPQRLFTLKGTEEKLSVCSKEDRRVQRTKQNLKDALLSLIQQKGFESITITDICRTGNYNRATFYAHYKSKQDLAAEMIDEKILHLIQSMEMKIPLEGKKIQDPIQPIFNYVEDQAFFFKVMFSGRTVPGFLAQLRGQLRVYFYKKVELLVPEFESYTVNRDVYVEYITFAMIGMISYWVRSGMVHNSEYMGKQNALILSERSGDRGFL